MGDNEAGDGYSSTPERNRRRRDRMQAVFFTIGNSLLTAANIQTLRSGASVSPMVESCLIGLNVVSHLAQLYSAYRAAKTDFSYTEYQDGTPIRFDRRANFAIAKFVSGIMPIIIGDLAAIAYHMPDSNTTPIPTPPKPIA